MILCVAILLSAQTDSLKVLQDYYSGQHEIAPSKAASAFKSALVKKQIVWRPSLSKSKTNYYALAYGDECFMESSSKNGKVLKGYLNEPATWGYLAFFRELLLHASCENLTTSEFEEMIDLGNTTRVRIDSLLRKAGKGQAGLIAARKVIGYVPTSPLQLKSKSKTELQANMKIAATRLSKIAQPEAKKFGYDAYVWGG